MPAPQSNTILVIDDNPADIHLLSDMLLSQGYQVAGALNGRDGFALALATPPKAILLDLYMPGLDGMATAKLIQSVPRLAAVPILFITGSTELDHKLKAFSAGAVDYITKPFSAAEVIARLRVHTRFSEALAQSLADEAKANVPAAVASIETAGQRLLRKAMDMLLADVIAPPMGAELAHAVGTNEKRLNDEFRSQLGLTVFEYVRKIRHQKACDLLLHTDLPMGQIAQRSGFKTAAAFTFSFRQQLGLTPTQFRAQAGVGMKEL